MSAEKDAKVTIGKTACEGGRLATHTDVSGEPAAVKAGKEAANPACFSDVVDRLGEVLP